MKYLLPITFCLLLFSANAQQRIDRTQTFQNDPSKAYSIYVPSNYTNGIENKMMVALHPLNVDRWNAKSWCDTLIDFAEANGLLLICPDGGSNGRIDDAIDTAFTSALIDSMKVWYSVLEQKVFLMGFSWGGKATYTYGLKNTEKFAGFMPVSAAISGDEIKSFAKNARHTNWYVIHGKNDNISIRYTPLLKALNDNNARVETNLLVGVGHTIDFANRNKILSAGFEWLDSVSSITASILPNSKVETLRFNLNSKSLILSDSESAKIQSLELFNLNGKKLIDVSTESISNTFYLEKYNLQSGVYVVKAIVNDQPYTLVIPLFLN